MPAATTEGEILTIKEVAEYLKVTERTIYRLAGAKKIPAFKAIAGKARTELRRIFVCLRGASPGA